MKEDLKDLRQMDANLGEAIRMEEMERPQLPPSLNARLLQRAEKEVNQPTKRRTVKFWPWVAAACVAAVIAVVLAPPKFDEGVSEGKQVAELQQDTAKVNTDDQQPSTPLQKENLAIQPEEQATPQLLAEATPEKTHAKPKVKDTEKVEQTDAEPIEVEDLADEKTYLAEATSTEVLPKKEPKVLSESDIPVTRPENLRYTKEELALMKKQANEAYMKWVELELEISKYNIEQTAANN